MIEFVELVELKIERFEDIKAWQEARVLVRMIYDAAKSDKAFSSDYRFRDQRVHPIPIHR